MAQRGAPAGLEGEARGAPVVEIDGAAVAVRGGADKEVVVAVVVEVAGGHVARAAAGGEGQMRATLDLAKEMGSNISRQQDARKLRGKVLFDEYKKKMNQVTPEAQQPSAQPAERQKIAEG